MQIYHFFIISRISIFHWSQGGWILATRDWWTEGYACLRDRGTRGATGRGEEEEQRQTSRREVLRLCRQGARPGALVAVWLRHPRVSATGQGAEQRSATVGAVSFCWWGKEVYCLWRTLRNKGNPAFVHRGIGQSGSAALSQQQPHTAGRCGKTAL